MDVVPVQVPGVYSQVGRNTHIQIQALVDICGLNPDKPEGLRRSTPADPGKLRVKARLRKALLAVKAAARLKVKESGAPEEPSGELARAIAKRLRQNAEAKAATERTGTAGSNPGSPSAATPAAVVGAAGANEQRATTPIKGGAASAFAAQGIYDGVWAGKLTASKSPGALNRWGEQRPDPGSHRLQYTAVQLRYPSWDIGEHPKHSARHRRDEHASTFGGSRPSRSLFLTDVDLGGDDDFFLSLPRSPPRDTRPAMSPRFGKAPMALASGRQELGKIGRVQVQANEVSEPAKDLLQQDIKGFPKLRYPEWDFEKLQPRPPLVRADDKSAPGKYDVPWGNGVVSAAPKNVIPFALSLSRSESGFGQLGHLAPAAVLLPEERRNPGTVCAPDRSKAKDCVRLRPTLVCDFARELPRPALPAAAHEYHDAHDPVADARVMQWHMGFDADAARVPVKHRRDAVRPFVGMAPRGRVAVQGVRILQDDVALRASLGLGCGPNPPPSPPPTQPSTAGGGGDRAIEGREPALAPERPPPLLTRSSESAPLFDHYTQFQPTLMQNNFNHGHAPVQGCHTNHFFSSKCSPLKKSAAKPLGTAAFERKAAGPGFMARAAVGGCRVLPQARAHEALLDWQAA